MELEITVKGMSCEGCERNVERAVLRLDGIMEVKADRKKAKCYVKYDETKVSLDEIIEAINELGYQALKP